MRAWTACLLAIVLGTTALAAAAPAQVLRRSMTSKQGQRRDLTVVLPPGYQASRRYPVLYLLDGQNLLGHPIHAGGWRAQDALEQAVGGGHAEPMIIVGVHAGNRMHEYTAVADPAHGGGGASAFVDELADEVVPFIEGQFATRSGRGARAIGGSSLGALGAMHALMKRDDTFGRGLILSPSVWWSNRQLLDAVGRSATLGQQHLVLYNGGAADGQAHAETLRDALASKGLRFNHDLFHWTEPGGTHDEAAWAHFLPRGLGVLFPAR